MVLRAYPSELTAEFVSLRRLLRVACWPRIVLRHYARTRSCEDHQMHTPCRMLVELDQRDRRNDKSQRQQHQALAPAPASGTITMTSSRLPELSGRCGERGAIAGSGWSAAGCSSRTRRGPGFGRQNQLESIPNGLRRAIRTRPSMIGDSTLASRPRTSSTSSIPKLLSRAESTAASMRVLVAAL